MSLGVTFSVMVSSLHELPEEIVLAREEYRLQHAALEAALDLLDRMPGAMSTERSALRSRPPSRCCCDGSGHTSMSSTIRIRLVEMGAIQEATITLGEAARRLGITVDALLELVYDGRLTAKPDPATGRLLVKSDDLAQLRP
jgi:hypothetical protein